MSLADDLRADLDALTVEAGRLAAERDRLAADLARVTAERDWSESTRHADFERWRKLLWIAEKHIPRDALAAYYAEQDAAFPVVPIGSPEASS